MSAKSLNLLPKPFPIPPMPPANQHFNDFSNKKRNFEDAEASFFPDKKAKLGVGAKRKTGKKMNISDETSSPVSGKIRLRLGCFKSITSFDYG